MCRLSQSILSLVPRFGFSSIFFASYIDCFSLSLSRCLCLSPFAVYHFTFTQCIEVLQSVAMIPMLHRRQYTLCSTVLHTDHTYRYNCIANANKSVISVILCANIQIGKFAMVIYQWNGNSREHTHNHQFHFASINSR